MRAMQTKSRQEYYRQLIIDMIPLQDDLAANGASKSALDAYAKAISIIEKDYEIQFGTPVIWE